MTDLHQPVKGFLCLQDSSSQTNIHALNWAFGRFELTKLPSLNSAPDLQGVSVRLTMMGARGEVMKRARKLAEAMGCDYA